MSLTQVIDALLEFVETSELIEQIDQSRFAELDRAVYVEAHKQALHGELPQPHEDLDALGKTNLPGGWFVDGSFIPMPTPGWLTDIRSLRSRDLI